MNLTIIGSGYVGLVTGACFAELGNDVVCMDNNDEIINNLKQGKIHIFEPGLEEIIKRNTKKKSLSFINSMEKAMHKAEIVFICVPTPQGEDGSADLKYVIQAAESIGKHLPSEAIIVNKSTVPVGTAEKVRAIISDRIKSRDIEIEFDVVSNPEFLKEGDAINDFMKPDRVIVGSDNSKSIDIMRQLYRNFMINHDRFISMDIRSSELTKYAANALLATKISFMNEVSHISEHLGADINLIREGIGSDRRIGYHFIYPGCGYGGSCLPKDVKGLAKMALGVGYETKLINSVHEVNNKQKYVLAQKVVDHFGENLSEITIAVWGLSFKPNTDDMREAPAITIINELIKMGARIQAYDPAAISNAKNHYFRGNNKIIYFEDKYDALKKSDCLILVTDWKEFRQPNFKRMKTVMKAPVVIFDGRNQYERKVMHEQGFKYIEIGYKVS